MGQMAGTVGGGKSCDLAQFLSCSRRVVESIEGLEDDDVRPSVAVGEGGHKLSDGSYELSGGAEPTPPEHLPSSALVQCTLQKIGLFQSLPSQCFFNEKWNKPFCPTFFYCSSLDRGVLGRWFKIEVLFLMTPLRLDW